MNDDVPHNMRRRAVLKGGVLGSVAALAVGQGDSAHAQSVAQSGAQSAPPKAPVPMPDPAAETGPLEVEIADPVTQQDCGSDFMVDVLKTLDLEYITLNPASSFRSLHESVVNYGGNAKPELITCLHEEIATAMAHGYAKVEGKPIGVMAHGTVGLQHASMALYNAYCDRVPIYMLIGNILAADKRGLVSEWQHSAQDPAVIVRDFLKWDDQPNTLQHFAESAVRAYQIATTPPYAPVLVSIDQEMQENPLPRNAKLSIPKLPSSSAPRGDSGAVMEVARLLVEAANPILMAGRLARTQAGMDRLVELAELLQCAVIDQGGRHNFPTHHPLNQALSGRGLLAQADVIVGFELSDYWLAVNNMTDRIQRRVTMQKGASAKTVHISARDLFTRSNYQEFGRYQEIDIVIPADGEATLPDLIEACRRLIDPARQRAFADRGAKLAEASSKARDAARSRATIGWNQSPITTGRLCAELYAQIRHEDWALVGHGIHTNWPRWLWDSDKIYRFTGGSGGWGLGQNLPGSLGGALANRKHGRLSVSIQGDGDFMYCPGTLWTAAHHKIPMLCVMHNNRAYHTELMYVQVMANRLNRGIRNTHIGNVITKPDIDFATLARGMGVYAEGPIEDPAKLGPALKRALAVVKTGLPALVDVVCDGR